MPSSPCVSPSPSVGVPAPGEGLCGVSDTVEGAAGEGGRGTRRRERGWTGVSALAAVFWSAALYTDRRWRQGLGSCVLLRDCAIERCICLVIDLFEDSRKDRKTCFRCGDVEVLSLHNRDTLLHSGIDERECCPRSGVVGMS